MFSQLQRQKDKNYDNTYIQTKWYVQKAARWTEADTGSCLGVVTSHTRIFMFILCGALSVLYFSAIVLRRVVSPPDPISSSCSSLSNSGVWSTPPAVITICMSIVSAEVRHTTPCSSFSINSMVSLLCIFLLPPSGVTCSMSMFRTGAEMATRNR